MAIHNFLSKSVAVVCGQVGYHFSPSGKPYPDNWIISDVFFENEGGTLQSRLACSSCLEPFLVRDG